MTWLSRSVLACGLIVATALPGIASSRPRRGPTSTKHTKTSSSKPSGQRSIDDTRATQIQASLIKSGYLSGEASGHWDSQTEAAMQKFQSDNGWQTKLIPDSRAIIKLGLGPSQDGTAAPGSQAMTHPPVSNSTLVQ